MLKDLHASDSYAKTPNSKENENNASGAQQHFFRTISAKEDMARVKRLVNVRLSCDLIDNANFPSVKTRRPNTPETVAAALAFIETRRRDTPRARGVSQWLDGLDETKANIE